MTRSSYSRASIDINRKSENNRDTQVSLDRYSRRSPFCLFASADDTGAISRHNLILRRHNPRREDHRRQRHFRRHSRRRENQRLDEHEDHYAGNRNVESNGDVKGAIRRYNSECLNEEKRNYESRIVSLFLVNLPRPVERDLSGPRSVPTFE
jgi:hypothetical protein